MKIKPEILEGKRIILASKSPRRNELLKLICSSFEVIPANTDETVPDGVEPDEAAEYTAVGKAKAINEDGIIIACDTIVIVDGEILGKPKDRQSAFEMLRKLSGKTHMVISGVALKCGERSLSFSDKTFVSFYNMSDSEIEDYLDSGEPFDKAGAYGIQGLGGVFVKEIQGDYFNVVGLPVAKLRKMLCSFAAMC